MKTKLFTLCISVVAMGCFLCGCSDEIKKDALEKYIYVNKSSLNIFLGDEVQLKANPEGESYSWTSGDPAIVSVTADGLVKAVSAGITEIVVSQGTSRTSVPVNVAIRVPLTDIIVDVESLKMSIGDKAQASAVPVPADATEVSLVWSSENPAVATVNVLGKIEAVGKGTTKIVVSQGNVRREILISIITLLNDNDWSVISCSDEQPDDGGGKGVLIDGNLTNYWHSQWKAPAAQLPHWAIIDMVSPYSVNKIETYRRSGNTNTKSVRYFVGNDPDPNAPSWVKIMEGTFASGNLLTLNAPENNIHARYLKIFLPDSNNGQNTSVAEIYVYGTE
ncbi:MAG: Ig-like domain-containing protein [Prevotellaceae bacterium]|nr:Ig-like domain-containing protein [Prevotellaceae bacterium]